MLPLVRIFLISICCQNLEFLCLLYINDRTQFATHCSPCPGPLKICED